MFIKDDRITLLTFDLNEGEVQAYDCIVKEVDDMHKPPLMLVHRNTNPEKPTTSLGWFATKDWVDDFTRFVVCDIEAEAQRLHVAVCNLLLGRQKRDKLSLETEIIKISNRMKMLELDRKAKCRLSRK